MPTNECLNCGATIDYNISISHKLEGQQLQTTITCPECQTKHRRFEKGQWTLLEDGDERAE